MLETLGLVVLCCARSRLVICLFNVDEIDVGNQRHPVVRMII